MLKELRNNTGVIESSYRDPSGFVFRNENNVYRQINKIYQKDYELLISTGLYDELTEEELLICHHEAPIKLSKTNDAWKIIKPNEISFISYPFEWCFGQLKDAALLTLKIQLKAIKKGMWLKDASAYNIQFINGRPIFIDTLSFARLPDGVPWIAYRQFCQHFLAPLYLINYKDWRLLSLLRNNLDGIPLDLAVDLIPARHRINAPFLMHLYLHSKSQKYLGKKSINKSNKVFSPNAMLGLMESLQKAILNIKTRSVHTQWSNYYDHTNYSDVASEYKEKIIKDYLDITGSGTVWDIGANDGHYSRLVSSNKRQVISMDFDMIAVEKNYNICKNMNLRNILPLVMDVTNPTPSIGWALKERSSLIERGPAHTVLVLALVHHLVITNNLPFDLIAEFLSKISKQLIVEYVAPNDSQVSRLIANRKQDSIHNLTLDSFDKAFGAYFNVIKADKLPNSKRIIFLFNSKRF